MLQSRQLRELVGRLRRLVASPESGAITDAELLERFVNLRDEAAFELLVWRHAAMVLGVCRRLLRQEQDAEDAFQATFLALARKAGSISRREATASWLYRVAYRVALRAKARTVSFEPLPANFAAPAANSSLEWRDLQPVLDEELTRLPEKLRAPVILCYLEGRTTEEAARHLRCPKGTILSRLARARDRMRRRLERRCITLSSAALGVAFAESARSATASAALVDGTTKAALLFAAGRAATGAISVHVTALTEGVLKAMFITRLKIALMVLLAMGLAGTGAGLYRSGLHGAEQPGADKNIPAKLGAAAEPEDRAATRQRIEPGDPAKVEHDAKVSAELNLTRARDDLEVARDELLHKERKWTEELIEARRILTELEEAVRRKERLHEAQRASERTSLDSERSQQRETERRLRFAKGQAGEADAQKAVDLANARIGQLEQTYGERDLRRSEELLKPRVELIKAEEHLRLLERQQALQRDWARAKTEAVEDRIRQLEGRSPRTNSSNRRQSDLERKVDTLLRELGELRKEVRGKK